jgi:hypothetical protein
MMKKIFTAIGIIIVAYIVLVVIAWNKPPSGRKEWIETQVQRLESFDPAKFDSSEILPNEGHDELFRFKDGGWIYAISHCSHFVDVNKILIGKSGEQIGDIAVAIDYRGNIYCSLSHACGGVHLLDLDEDEELEDLSHFIKCTDMCWIQTNPLTSTWTLP